MENLKRTEKLEPQETDLKKQKIKKFIIQTTVISLTAGAFFTLGFFQPHAEKNPTHFVSNTQKHNDELKKLSETQTQLQSAQKQLSDAQAKTKQARADEKTANETKTAIYADIKEKQGTQDILNESIGSLKAQKESLETQIATEKTVQTATSPVGAPDYGPSSMDPEAYKARVNELAAQYKNLTADEVSVWTTYLGPAYNNMYQAYKRTNGSKDAATTSFINDNPANLSQDKNKQLACLLYDIVAGIAK